MNKPQDRLNPHSSNDSWSDFESWGGRSWFTPNPHFPKPKEKHDDNCRCDKCASNRK